MLNGPFSPWPSYSEEEHDTAAILNEYLTSKGYHPQQKGNNVWARGNHYDATKPTLLLNSHHDTVHATSKWINDPFKANLLEGKLIGLGSNDAGGPLVSLLHTFIELDKK